MNTLGKVVAWMIGIPFALAFVYFFGGALLTGRRPLLAIGGLACIFSPLVFQTGWSALLFLPGLVLLAMGASSRR